MILQVILIITSIIWLVLLFLITLAKTRKDSNGKLVIPKEITSDSLWLLIIFFGVLFVIQMIIKLVSIAN